MKEQEKAGMIALAGFLQTCALASFGVFFGQFKDEIDSGWIVAVSLTVTLTMVSGALIIWAILIKKNK